MVGIQPYLLEGAISQKPLKACAHAAGLDTDANGTAPMPGISEAVRGSDRQYAQHLESVVTAAGTLQRLNIAGSGPYHHADRKLVTTRPELN